MEKGQTYMTARGKGRPITKREGTAGGRLGDSQGERGPGYETAKGEGQGTGYVTARNVT